MLPAYGIFAAARAAWAAQNYPRYLSYSVRVTGTLPSGDVTDTYAAVADTQDGTIHVRATSAEQAQHPYVPHGVDFHVKLKISYSRHTQISHPSADGDVHVSKTVNVSPPSQEDVFGVPVLSPDYSFGLRPPSLTGNGPNPGGAPGLKTIASVTAVRRDYAVRYDGEETIDGAPCYVLALRPLRKPDVFRLRRLWIDEITFATHEALLQGNFTEGPGPSLPWLVRFMQIGGATYIRDESTTSAVHYLGHAYATVAIAFENIEPTAAPGTLWALTLFGTHGDVLKEPALDSP
ncbi:MAG TPA: hypothetical protein VIO32_08415 [Candidatus Baltobacteraceae bacterium]